MSFEVIIEFSYRTNCDKSYISAKLQSISFCHILHSFVYPCVVNRLRKVIILLVTHTIYYNSITNCCAIMSPASLNEVNTHFRIGQG